MNKTTFRGLCVVALTDDGRHLRLVVVKVRGRWKLELTGSRWLGGDISRVIYAPLVRKLEPPSKGYERCCAVLPMYQRWLDEWKRERFPKEA